MTLFTRPHREIKLSALAQNYQSLRALAGSARAAGVVKNDAYGLGGAEVTKRLVRAGCKAFFVAHAFEGVAVRKEAPLADIYVLQGMGQDSIKDMISARLTPVLSTPAQLKFWVAQGVDEIRPIVQVETGLNRLGLRMMDIAALTPEQKAGFSYILSHLACADTPAHFMNNIQLKQFCEIRESFPEIPLTLSASDGVFLGVDFAFDMVRLGAAMYGLNTAPYRPAIVQPVLFISAPVLQIVDLKAGEYVGYGATYQAPHAMRMAVVSIGYGDGLPRALSNVGHVRWQGKEGKIIGRISMDNIMVDVSEMGALKEGDFVSILDEVYTPDKMAAQAGTIGYEILSNLGKGGRWVTSYTD